MALRIHILPPNTLNQLPKFLPNPVLCTRHRSQITCSNTTDAKLASELATEVAKMNTHLTQKEEAMKRSKELLFAQFCQYLALKEEEVERKWRSISEEEKWVFVKGFVTEWGVNFHPLSARSVKEMVEEHLGEVVPSSDPSPSALFPGWKRMLWF